MNQPQFRHGDATQRTKARLTKLLILTDNERTFCRRSEIRITALNCSLMVMNWSVSAPIRWRHGKFSHARMIGNDRKQICTGAGINYLRYFYVKEALSWPLRGCSPYTETRARQLPKPLPTAQTIQRIRTRPATAKYSVTGYQCDPRTVDAEFLLSKQQYMGARVM